MTRTLWIGFLLALLLGCARKVPPKVPQAGTATEYVAWWSMGDKGMTSWIQATEAGFGRVAEREGLVKPGPHGLSKVDPKQPGDLGAPADAPGAVRKFWESNPSAVPVAWIEVPSGQEHESWLAAFLVADSREPVAMAIAPRENVSLEELEKALGPGNPQSERVRVMVARRDVQKGPATAPVTIVEFSDFQCPFCRKAAGTTSQLLAEFPGIVRLVFKHNPLPFHPHAMLAAQASLAAGEQGKFWEMHDKLFAAQSSMDREAIEKHAQELGLDMDAFREAVDSERYKPQVEADMAQAARLGATGTPTFFINGKVLTGAQPLEEFRRVINEEHSSAVLFMTKKQVSAENLYDELMRDARVGAAERPSPRPVVAADAATVYKVPVGGAPVLGEPGAKLTIIIFSDFECPFCARVEPTLAQLRAKYGADLRLAWKNLPLPFHPHAALAAEAALAANEQGQFWAYHDRLFQNQQALMRADLEAHAAALNLDMAKFKEAFDSGKFKKNLQEDGELAQRFGVRGTPSFFINGRPLRGAQPLEAFVSLCDEELARANALLATGVQRQRLYDELVKDGETRVEARAERRPGEPDPDTVHAVEISPDHPSLGPKKAAVTIVEFSDFQCPFCGRVAPTLRELRKKYPKDVRIVFKNLPLSMHPDAFLAAEAALAAGEQGKFWQMHDKLFENQARLGREDLEAYAKQLGLNMTKFKAALDDHKFKDKVDRDLAEATRLHVNGTPSFFINGRFLAGAMPLETFVARCEAALAKVKK
ncbi:MAG: thioredoxin domain-containing protein [Deltaproteobacteria bacterium]|nr:thioredoxin domain-containing protein [Deltaproteobacteria bacterium]